MKMSKKGAEILIAREGERTNAYRDTKGIWTIGVGHTGEVKGKKVGRGMVLSHEEVVQLFQDDLRVYEDAVNSVVTGPLTQNQFDALVSLCFNIGVGGFKKSTVVRRLNAGDVKGAAEAIMMWNKPKEILGRRQGEKRQFLTS